MHNKPPDFGPGAFPLPHIFPASEYHGMSAKSARLSSEGNDMCNNNGLCGCLNNNWWWIVILILLLCNCGGNDCGCGNSNSGCGCGC